MLRGVEQLYVYHYGRNGLTVVEDLVVTHLTKVKGVIYINESKSVRAIIKTKILD